MNKKVTQFTFAHPSNKIRCWVDQWCMSIHQLFDSIIETSTYSYGNKHKQKVMLFVAYNEINNNMKVKKCISTASLSFSYSYELAWNPLRIVNISFDSIA